MPNPSPFDQAEPTGYHVSRADETLPDTLPTDPMPTVVRWFDEARARKVQPNPNAMTVATVDADGTVQARILLCKKLDPSGFFVFYTNYESRKARAIAEHPSAALVFHWDTLDRQIRVEGPIVKSPPEESDAYFASRPWESRVGAWASNQSQPVASREDLFAQVWAAMHRFNINVDGPAEGNNVVIPRPPHWGGYRVFARRIELWVAGTGRVHDRAAWTRSLTPAGPHAFTAGAWTAQRLQP